MPALVLALSLLAPADDMAQLQGEWRSARGNALIIVENRIGIFNGEEDFLDRLIVRLGMLQVVVDAETAFRAPYRRDGDKLTLTVEYRRKPVMGVSK